MKLQIVPASRGIQWVKLGVQTFFRQPLALSSLFFMLLAMMSVVKIVPVVGGLLTFVLTPGFGLGMMVATREASSGKFPMPLILLSAFRANRPQLRSMLGLGALYGLGVVFIVGCTALVDGGKFAGVALLGNSVTEDSLQEMGFQIAMLVFSALNLPLLILFFHAAALRHWHAVPPVKGLFFCLTAMLRNFRAYLVYGLVWIGVSNVFGIIMASLAGLLGSANELPIALVPVLLMMLAMAFTSIYFTFLDSFAITPGADT